MTTHEHLRIREITNDAFGWRRWGPYLSDRAWATVREDYSPHGDAWGYLPHDLARSKAYRWGEDGIAGVCDRYQILCFAPAFWNGNDPILKERLFGLTPHEGNHGEDVKEYYFHLDCTPTHSYMKFLYKYPQAAYPYGLLAEENRRRGGHGFEYELLDTGVFNEDRYFDVFIEYAKADPEDLCIKIEAFNRGPDAAPLHLLPHLWFRNQWGWSCESWNGQAGEPSLRPGPLTPNPSPPRGEGRKKAPLPSGERGWGEGAGYVTLVADDARLEVPTTIPAKAKLGRRILYAPPGCAMLFTDNETNAARVFGPQAKSRKPHVKDAFHRHIINGEQCVNPALEGTKAALHYRFDAVPPGGSVALVLRLSDKDRLADPLGEAKAVLEQRRAEADEFYAAIHRPKASADERLVQRQAFAGLLWSKQSYLFDVDKWFEGDCPEWPPPASRRNVRNAHWQHIYSMRVMTMPDKWEYPWFAAWDLAFHTVAFAVVDGQYAKDQLWILLFEQFQHPNGQIPAYEWEFSDLNPPVHAWAVWRVYNMDRIRAGKADRPFLERCFHKLLVNFAWWINKVDREGNNVFEGGFLGLDNITVVDRSERSSDGAVLEQADATGWMGMFCLNMMRIALELARENPVYEGMAVKFFQHYAYIAKAMKHMGKRNYALWDEEDGFFYDVLSYPDGRHRKFRVRSLVGLIPLFAVERLEMDWIAPFKEFSSSFDWVLRNRPDLVKDVVHKVEDGDKLTYALTILDQEQIRRLMRRVFDANEFLSDYGIRSLSRAHREQPFEFDGKIVGYEPAESDSKLKGGNSNWRGPIWFPTSFLLIESLRKLGKAFGPRVAVDTPLREQPLTFNDMAREIAERLIRIFTRDASGRRAVYGGTRSFQEDPHWRDYVQFFEYFHGDNGAGLGASHQTGWTALVASLIDEWRGK